MRIEHFFAVITAAALSFAACQPTNSEEGGATSEVADIFFSAANGDYCYYVGQGETAEAELAIFRENATDKAEYAIQVISKDDGITVPESVKFEAGQTEATIVVQGPAEAAVRESFSFEIKFTGDNVNPSANSVQGTLLCEGTFYFYEEMIGDACFGDESYNFMGDIRQVVWRISNTEFIFKNFLGSDYDLKVFTDNSGTITNLVGGYDLYTQTDTDGGVTYKFYNESVADFEGNYYYEEFFPKGENRSIYNLSFLVQPGYSAFVERNGSTPAYFYLRSPLVAFWVYDAGEEGNGKSFTWPYFYIYFYSSDYMEKLDFENFPEVEFQSYPESDYVEEPKDGLIPIQVYLENEEIDLDTQWGVATDAGGVLIQDFMQTGCSLEVIPSADKTSFSLEVKNTTGDVVSGAIDGYYVSLGMEYTYPWKANMNWCMYGLSVYYDSQYSYWPSAQDACFYASYTIYNGDTGQWLEAQEGYIDIYW